MINVPFSVWMERPSALTHGIIERSFSHIERLTDVRIPRNYVNSEDSLLKSAYSPSRKQTDVSTLWQNLQKSFWDGRTYQLGVLETDMYGPGTNFVYAATIKKVWPNGMLVSDKFATGSIFSVYRLKNYYDANWQEPFLLTLIHEEGHFFGLPTSSNLDYIKENDPRANSGLDFGHCDNRLCSMEQIDIPNRLSAMNKAKYIFQKNPSLFCNTDLEALKNNARKLFE